MNTILKFFRKRKAYLNTVRELSKLSDRDLHDIGLGRCDIRRLALDVAETVR